MSDTFTQEQLDAAIKKAVAENESGLVAKRDELLGTVKALKGKLGAYEDIDPAEYRAAVDSVKKAEQENLEKKGQYDVIVEQMKSQWASEKSEWEAKYNAENAFSTNLLTQGGLSDSLAKINVTPQLFDAAKALISPRVAIQGDGDDRKAVIGDKPLAEYVAEWAASDEGKAFVAAPNSSGGGAAGDNGKGKANTTGMKWADMSPAQKSDAFTKQGQDAPRHYQ